MKKLLLIGLLFYGTSCTNPEDRATGDADSTTFNSNENEVLNTASDNNNPMSQMPDSSVSPATSGKNASSSTNGTNRGYGTGRDSSRQ